jgi:hypothetical protein
MRLGLELGFRPLTKILPQAKPTRIFIPIITTTPHTASNIGYQPLLKASTQNITA